MRRLCLAMLALCLAFPALAQDTPAALPKTCDAAVDVLVATMSAEDLNIPRASPETDLIQFHFGLGMGIRNEFGLWGGNQALASDCVRLFPDMEQPQHPDTISMMIITHLWRRLNASP